MKDFSMNASLFCCQGKMIHANNAAWLLRCLAVLPRQRPERKQRETGDDAVRAATASEGQADRTPGPCLPVQGAPAASPTYAYQQSLPLNPFPCMHTGKSVWHGAGG